MDGFHDLGGMHGLGAATWPGAEDALHAPWELRAFALALLASPGSAHRFRHTIERLEPVAYLEAGYYAKWLYEVEAALVEDGAIASAEVDAWEARVAAGATPPVRRDPEGAAAIRRALTTSRPLRPAAAARFAAGDAVRVRRMRPAGHTRCPRYLRGALGVVERVHGDDGVPDVDEAEREAVYDVRFSARDLWGDDAGAHVVHADLWERYLEPVDA